MASDLVRGRNQTTLVGCRRSGASGTINSVSSLGLPDIFIRNLLWAKSIFRCSLGIRQTDSVMAWQAAAMEIIGLERPYLNKA